MTTCDGGLPLSTIQHLCGTVDSLCTFKVTESGHALRVGDLPVASANSGGKLPSDGLSLFRYVLVAAGIQVFPACLRGTNQVSFPGSPLRFSLLRGSSWRGH